MKPGTLVGPYQITTLIARGGVGIVYRATDTRLDRQVALKTLASLGVPDELRVERFLREARITASLDHPNIVKVFDVGTHDGQPFMVVELLEGETLRKRFDRGPLAESDVRRIGIEIARGFVFAHAAGLVHRGTSPSRSASTEPARASGGPRLGMIVWTTQALGTMRKGFRPLTR